MDHQLRELLVGILGEANVLDDKAIRFAYSMDLTPEPPMEPDCVVTPSTVEEVIEVVKLANKFRKPIIPYVCGSNVGGLTIPEKMGSIIMDLHKMNRIIEVNEKMMYAVVEPGVTWGQLDAELAKKNLFVAPPIGNVTAGVVPCLLLAGVGHGLHAAARHEDQSRHITGLEVVLPTGEVARIGSISVSPYWWGRPPLPDLAGVFIGWCGTTGIVTKMGLAVYEKPPYVNWLSFGAENIRDVTELLSTISRLGVCDDIRGSLWTERLVVIQKWPLKKPTDMPEWNAVFCLSAWSGREMEAKKEIVRVKVQELQDKGSTVKERTDPSEPTPTMPTDMFTMSFSHKGVGGGVFFAGVYSPIARWPILLERWWDLNQKYGFTWFVGLKPYAGSRYGLSIMICYFDKSDPKDIAMAREYIGKAVEIGVEEGGLPFKPTTQWMRKIIISKMDKNTYELMRKIKRLLDPNNILNPGKLGLDLEGV